MNSEETVIAAVLARYENALNGSSVDEVMALYADDGVFMPQNSQSSVGKDAIRRAYQMIFRTITLNVKFDVVEVHLVAPMWAFARANSAGKTTVHASGEILAEANQELFVFRKVSDGWKIARYCFATTNAAKG